MAYNTVPFHDALPNRSARPHLPNPARPLAHTGPPPVTWSDSDADLGPWTPYTLFSPLTPVDDLTILPPHLDDLPPHDDDSFHPATLDTDLSTSDDLHHDHEEPHSPACEEGLLADDQTSEGSLAEDTLDDEPTPPLLRRSERLSRLPRAAAHAYAVSVATDLRIRAADISAVAEVFNATATTIPTDLGSSGSDPALFLPEPRRLKEVLQLPSRICRGWLAAWVKEIKGMIFRRNSFKLEDPTADDKVIPIMEVFKCKIDMHGLIDKLKCRIVFRGDLYEPLNPQDSWNPHADFNVIRIFLALCARFHMLPSQHDYVIAYLQVAMQ